MTICYDFQKWTMISLVSVAISLTIGLLSINFADGRTISNASIGANFTFNHPDDWIIYKQGNRFNGYLAAVVPSYYSENAMVTIGEVSSMQITDDKILEGINNSTKHSVEVRGLDSTPFEQGIDKYIVNNKTAPYTIHKQTCGKYAVYDCEDQIHMTAIVKLPTGQFTMFQYIAHPDSFDYYLSGAEQILKSIRPAIEQPP